MSFRYASGPACNETRFLASTGVSNFTLKRKNPRAAKPAGVSLFVAMQLQLRLPAAGVLLVDVVEVQEPPAVVPF